MESGCNPGNVGETFHIASGQACEDTAEASLRAGLLHDKMRVTCLSLDGAWLSAEGFSDQVHVIGSMGEEATN